jgi:GT2 family glycosyltransferase
MPIYGKPDITAMAIKDLHEQSFPVDIWVVDNQGEHIEQRGEHVVRPETNLGWLGGTNAGIQAARDLRPYTHFLLLNNDVRLSSGLVSGLLNTDADISAPCYDGFWNHQHTDYTGSAAMYKPGRVRWRAAFVDGTCLLVTHALINSIGGLDPVFQPYGWGAEVDLGLRAHAAGMSVVVSNAAYVEHAGEATAISVHGQNYGAAARAHMYSVLNRRYGPIWEITVGIDRRTHNTRYIGRRRRVAETLLLAVKRGRDVDYLNGFPV